MPDGAGTTHDQVTYRGLNPLAADTAVGRDDGVVFPLGLFIQVR